MSGWIQIQWLISHCYWRESDQQCRNPIECVQLLHNCVHVHQRGSAWANDASVCEKSHAVQQPADQGNHISTDCAYGGQSIDAKDVWIDDQRERDRVSEEWKLAG